jgi:hypothetical protein
MRNVDSTIQVLSLIIFVSTNPAVCFPPKMCVYEVASIIV